MSVCTYFSAVFMVAYKYRQSKAVTDRMVRLIGKVADTDLGKPGTHSFHDIFLIQQEDLKKALRDFKLELETLKPEQFQRRTEIQNDLTNIAGSEYNAIILNSR